MTKQIPYDRSILLDTGNDYSIPAELELGFEHGQQQPSAVTQPGSDSPGINDPDYD